MMIKQVAVHLLFLADRVRAEGTVNKTIILLVVLLVVLQGTTCLEIARGAEKNSRVRTVSGRVDVLVSLLCSSSKPVHISTGFPQLA